MKSIYDAKSSYEKYRQDQTLASFLMSLTFERNSEEILSWNVNL